MPGHKMYFYEVLELGVVSDALNPSTWETETGGALELEASLV